MSDLCPLCFHCLQRPRRDNKTAWSERVNHPRMNRDFREFRKTNRWQRETEEKEGTEGGKGGGREGGGGGGGGGRGIIKKFTEHEKGECQHRGSG